MRRAMSVVLLVLLALPQTGCVGTIVAVVIIKKKMDAKKAAGGVVEQEPGKCHPRCFHCAEKREKALQDGEAVPEQPEQPQEATKIAQKAPETSPNPGVETNTPVKVTRVPNAF